MSTRPKSLRRSVLGGKKSRNKSGGWRGNWTDRLDIPKAESTPILLTRGEYPMKGTEKNELATEEDPEPMAYYHTCLSHGVKLKPSGPGSYYTARCNLDAGDEDCLLCFAKEHVGDRRVSTKWLYSFNVLHLDLYERVQKTDYKSGKPLFFDRDTKNHKKGDPIMTWQHVERPRDRKEILDSLAESDELLEMGEDGEEGGVRLFSKKYIEVGRGHRDQLVEIDEAAAAMCRCGGNLTPVAFKCEACEEEIMDVEEANMTPAEVKAFAEQRQRCDHCGHVGHPLQEPICDSCDEPTPLTAFDVVAWVRRKGEGTNSRIDVEKIERLDEFEFPNGASLIEWSSDDEGDYPVEDEDGDWVFTEENGVKAVAEAPWDFEKVHSPRDHEYHAGRLGNISVPTDFTPSTHSMGGRRSENPAASKYRNYGSQRLSSGSEDEGTEDEGTEENSSRRSRRGRRGRGGRRRRE